jgi:hypothetical protein
MNRLLRTSILAAALSTPSLASDIWIEAESASNVTLHSNPWFADARKSVLSNGDWLAHFSEPTQPVGTATLEFDAPSGGTYQLWLRMGNDVAFRLNEGELQTAYSAELRQSDRDNQRNRQYKPKLNDSRNFAPHGNADGRFLFWVRFGEVELKPGRNTLELQLGKPGDEVKQGVVDAILFTQREFEPDGAIKPGERNHARVELDMSRRWLFKPARDRFGPDSLIDLRSLNEQTAGEHGFIGLAQDRMSFVRGDGQPIRFWGGTNYAQRSLDFAALKDHAHFLARRGINVVRWHGDMPIGKGWPDSRKQSQSIHDIDEKELDEAFKLVAAMKSAGIYTILSPYWGSHTNIRDEWRAELPATPAENLSGLVFFVPEVQKAYKGYLRALYTRPNPYTGVALKDEPAVAIIQIQNEDSLLFYTADRIAGEPKKLLQSLYKDHLFKKYSGIDAIRSAWSVDRSEAEQAKLFENELPEILIAWSYSADALRDRGASAGWRAQRADQLEFMTRLMMQFNQEIEDYLRNELGAKQLINAGNWKTVDRVIVDDAERISYTANDVMGKNHYFSAFHTGVNRGYQIKVDHVYTDESATLNPIELPSILRQPAGFPFIIGESLWVPPNVYEAEGPMMIASHSALNGLDLFLWFETSSDQFGAPGRGESLDKWNFATPMQLGQFPAASLIFRHALVDQADPVVIEHRSFDDVWQGRFPATAEGASFDPNRDSGLGVDKTRDYDAVIDPRSFLAGPVQVEYSDLSKPPTVHPRLESLIAGGRVTSLNGQVVSDSEKGLWLVNAPKAQAAVGFLGGAGPIALADVQIECRNDYASIAVVALDGEPIATSGRLLVQMGTQARPAGFAHEPADLLVNGKPMAARRIASLGDPSVWAIEKLDATVNLANPRLTRARVLDSNFQAIGEVPLQATPGGVSITLPADALHLLVE